MDIGTLPIGKMPVSDAAVPNGDRAILHMVIGQFLLSGFKFISYCDVMLKILRLLSRTFGFSGPTTKRVSPASAIRARWRRHRSRRNVRELRVRGLTTHMRGPRVRIPPPPPARWYGAGGEEMAPSSLHLTDGV